MPATFIVKRFKNIKGLAKYIGVIPTEENTLEVIETAINAAPLNYEYHNIISLLGGATFVVYKLIEK